MQYSPYQKRSLSIKYSFNDIPLQCLDEFRLLGLTVDTNINWKAHINFVSNKLASFAYALNDSKRSTDFKTAKTAYYAYAYSWLTYGIIVWGNCIEVEKLFILQKRCGRILANIDQM
ncbi:hypothetical protein PYW07_004408 [Mythimna separata]|uniref:Uncharacterized protein n=1 Tax=Mythimna separata TaxID=271217 RepID=A0AAD7YWV5_MYTSE|nr:hypothetical protein PYW07_004408 [Mythimna separata]